MPMSIIMASIPPQLHIISLALNPLFKVFFVALQVTLSNFGRSSNDMLALLFNVIIDLVN